MLLSLFFFFEIKVVDDFIIMVAVFCRPVAYDECVVEMKC